MAKKGATSKIYKSAKTGRFVTKKHVVQSPGTTVTQTVKRAWA